MKKWFVYKILHPLTGDIIYIGITTNPKKRYMHYIYEDSFRLYVRYFKLLTYCGLKLNIKTEAIVFNLSDALKEEKKLIKKYTDLGIPLLNGDSCVKNRWSSKFLNQYFSRVIPSKEMLCEYNGSLDRWSELARIILGERKGAKCKS